MFAAQNYYKLNKHVLFISRTTFLYHKLIWEN